MKKILYKSYIDTPIGQMLSISDAQFLYRLDFIETEAFKRKLEKLDVSLLEHPPRFHVRLRKNCKSILIRKEKVLNSL